MLTYCFYFMYYRVFHMANKLTIDEILKEEEDASDMSIDVSFTCDDILKEKENIESDQDDFGDPFEEEDEVLDQIQDTKPSKVSDTYKSRSTYQLARQQSSTAQTRRAFRIKDTLLKPQTLQKSMTYVQLSLVSAAFDPNNKLAKGVGLPTCIFTTSSKYMAIGTSLANIALFEVGSKDYRVLKDTEKKNVLVGNPVSIAMSEDSKWMVVGFEGGGVGLWDLASLSLVKTVPSMMQDSSKIVKVLFWKGNTDFLSVDMTGNVILHTIEKYVWTSIRSRKLFSSTPSLYHDAKVTKLQNGRIILALVNVDFVFLINLDPNIEIITKIARPGDIDEKKIPNCEFGKAKSQDAVTDILCVSWAKTIFIYKFNSMNRPEKVFEPNRQYEWDQPIYNMQMISFNALLVIDNKNTFKLLNITQDLDKGAIKHQMTLENDLIPQRIMKDKSGELIKNFTNRVSKCTQDFKEVFLLTKGSVTRGRLHSWTDFIRYLIKQKEWDQILKASIEIFFGRLDIFAQKVLITPNTVLLFNELLVVYLKSRLDDLNDKQLTTAQARQLKQQILDSVIEFCLDLQLNDLLFNRVFDMLNTEYNLAEEFMASLSPFIELDMLKVVPNKQLLRAIMQFYAVHRIDLVDRLIMNLQYDSIDYLSTIQVCSRSKLYPSLMYISQLFGDFLQPLNQIIADCKNLSDEGYSQQKLRQYESLIYQYIISTINGKTLSGVRLNRALQEIGIRRVFVWYFDGNNNEYFITENSKNYFDGLAEILTQETVCEISDTIVDRVDILGYVFEKMIVTLGKLNKEKYNQDFSECIMIISRIWDLDGQILTYALEHFKPGTNNTVLAKFVNKNFNVLKQLPGWKSTIPKFPQQIQGQIQCRQGKYKQAIDIYKSLKDISAQQRLFQLIPQKPFLQFLHSFIDLNVSLSATCIYQKFCAQTIDEQVSNLPNDILKYQLIRKLIMIDHINDIRWRQSTTLFYLESLCKYRNEKRVLCELRRRDFCILKALEIIKKYNLKWCEAYLCESNLEFEVALEMYGEIYQRIFKEEFKQVMRYVFVNGRELRRVFGDMVRVLGKMEWKEKEVGDLCRIVLAPFKEEFGKRTKSTVARQVSNISKKKGDQRQFINTLSQILQQTLQTCSHFLPLAQITSLFQQYKPVFQQPLFLNLYCSTLINLHRDLNITLDTERIMLGDINDNFNKVMSVKSRAITGGQFCEMCQESVSGTNATVFPCGCCVHEMCGPSNPEECPACKVRKQGTSNQNFRRILKPNVPSRKRDLRKSSLVSDSGLTYQYLACDAHITKDGDQLVDMLMADLKPREPDEL